MKKTSIIKQCEVCQKDFKAHQFSIKNGHARFCSLVCKGKAKQGVKSGGSYRDCLLCSKEFYAKPSHIKKGWAKYCSPKCARNNDEWRDLMSKTNSGRVRTTEMRKKMSESKVLSPYTPRGANNPAWKGGVTPENARIRHSVDYRLWREAVFARDNFTCQHCAARGGELNADHIKPFSLFPELRFAINNGRTLCVSCHSKTPTFQSKVRNMGRGDFE